MRTATAEAGYFHRASRHAELSDRAAPRASRRAGSARDHSRRNGARRTPKAQEAFKQDKDVLILLATDAAGEGINLQRAHLMVNYDLPWNPNRLEQRFGRIHRIGQTEVCHLWNLSRKRRARATYTSASRKDRTGTKALAQASSTFWANCSATNGSATC